MNKEHYPRLTIALGIAVAVAGFGTSAPAQQLHERQMSRVAVDLSSDDNNGDYDCKGGAARIGGDHNKVTLRNCRTVSIGGSENMVVTVRPGAVEVLGNNNVVDWFGPGKPAISNSGAANSVIHLTTPPDD